MTVAAGEGLVLERVRAGYGDTVVLEGISLTLAPRATMAILGRNGVGKTTLLATIMGRTSLHAGSIRYGGRPVAGAPAWHRSRIGIGFVPQEREIFGSLTAEENLTVAARPGRWSLDRIYDLFPSLAARRGNGGNELSGGEQQMLSIGRALMGNPTLLLLDEPLEGLAPVIVDVVLRSIERLKREDNLAIQLVEQHARIALEHTERAIVLDRGRIVYHGESASLLATPERLAALMGVTRASA
jgi:branched-chain amino acid transport system ATP-binding protein